MSQYLEDYLVAAELHRWTPGTFLAYTLRGDAKHNFFRGYHRALVRALGREVESGRVVEVRSVKGGRAYIEVD